MSSRGLLKSNYFSSLDDVIDTLDANLFSIFSEASGKRPVNEVLLFSVLTIMLLDLPS